MHDSFHAEPPWNGTAAKMMRTELASWHLLNPQRERRDALPSLPVISGHHKR